MLELTLWQIDCQCEINYILQLKCREKKNLWMQLFTLTSFVRRAVKGINM